MNKCIVAHDTRVPELEVEEENDLQTARQRRVAKISTLGDEVREAVEDLRSGPQHVLVQNESAIDALHWLATRYSVVKTARLCPGWIEQHRDAVIRRAEELDVAVARKDGTDLASSLTEVEPSMVYGESLSTTAVTCCEGLHIDVAELDASRNLLRFYLTESLLDAILCDSAGLLTDEEWESSVCLQALEWIHCDITAAASNISNLLELLGNSCPKETEPWTALLDSSGVEWEHYVKRILLGPRFLVVGTSSLLNWVSFVRKLGGVDKIALLHPQVPICMMPDLKCSADQLTVPLFCPIGFERVQVE